MIISYDTNNIIILSTADWNAPYLTNKQHMAKEFSKLGFTVLYVESLGLRQPHISDMRDLKRIIIRLLRSFMIVRKAEINIWVCSPLQIPLKRHIPTISLFNKVLLSIQLKLAKSILRMKEYILWSYHADCASFKNDPKMLHSVYHYVDDLTAVPGVDIKHYNDIHYKFEQWCDHIFITNWNLKSTFSSEKKNIHFLPNVVDVDHFRNASSISAKDLPNGKPIVGYHGALSNFKIDLSLLLDLVTICHDLNFVIIGDEREGQSDTVLTKLKACHNVYMLGYKPYTEIPQYLCHFDVALLPLKKNKYTNGMFPMKYYEYIAALVPVVSTNAGFIDNLDIKPRTGDDPDELRQVILETLSEGKLSTEQSNAIIGDNTWAQRTSKMLSIMKISNKYSNKENS